MREGSDFLAAVICGPLKHTARAVSVFFGALVWSFYFRLRAVCFCGSFVIPGGGCGFPPVTFAVKLYFFSIIIDTKVSNLIPKKEVCNAASNKEDKT